ncbi:MAG: metalloregulator ArsR/SmtB family transcription factor [Sulfuricaulis sp.]
MTLTPEILFQALGDPTRLRLLMLLTTGEELCVCELTHALELSQPMISRHLANLRSAGLVSDRRAGVWIYYRLHSDLPKWAQTILHETLRGFGKTQPYRTDRKTLRAMPNRPAVTRCG